MAERFRELIRYASPMHDIGKVGVPERILLKPGPLTPQEWEIMTTHTTIGARILHGSDSPFLKMAEEIALSHHERWIGGGYPQGLKGDKIPFSARITNIADQYDALRSRRPYKSALGHAKVVCVLTKGDGRTMPEHFDPTVLDVFIKNDGLFAEVFEDSISKKGDGIA
ncbi:MAG: HD domain-containing phosphohydrolase [Candidatus Omnitrophota bacterium]